MTIAATLACALFPILVCVAAGSTIGHRARGPGADMLVGFGLLTGVLAILATTTRLPLTWLMGGLAGASAIALMVRRPVPGGRSTWIAVALLSPVLVKAAGQEPVGWDDFWNWLPSAAYDYYRNSLPWPDLPPSLSIFPGYPQGMPLMIAAASFIAGRFLESAGGVMNVLLLAGSSALLADALATARIRQGRLQKTEPPAVLVAIAVLITTLLNPGLDGAVLLSSYADCGTMVAVGALGLLGTEILARLSSQQPANVEGLAWRFGLVGAMLVNLKQANPVLFVLITAGLVLVVLRDPAIPRRPAALQLPRMLGPAILLFAVWRWYVTHYLSDAEQIFRPFATWNFAALRSTLTSIGFYIADAPLFHALMWSITAAGLFCLFRPSRKAGEAQPLAIIGATVWLGYNAFLLLVYLGAMSVSDAYGAADYWRYTPHVALLGLYTPVMALARARGPTWMPLRSAGATLAAIWAVMLLALCVLLLRADLRHVPGTAWQRFVRESVVEMRRTISPGSKVAILSFSFANASPFGVAARYHLWQLDAAEQPIATMIRWDDRDLASVTRAAARGELDYLIIQDADGDMRKATDALGLPPLHHELGLFGWRAGAWERLQSWPIPPALIHSPSS
jgi:hypothetical protein